MDLQNKVIAITGGARGIGRSIAQHLAGKGTKLALLDMDAVGLQETVELLQSQGVEARPYVCNVSDEASVVATFAKIVEDFGTIHGLVNNAGIIRDQQLLKIKEGKVIDRMSVENYDLVVAVHMKGSFLCAREAAAFMVESGVEDGCIVSMSSIGNLGNFGQTNYSAAKAGMVAQSRVWAKELGRYGIRSMCVAPGVIDTDMLNSMPKAARDSMAAGVPLKRIGRVDNIALTVAHIFENDYLSGEVIEVAGGLRV